MMDGLIKNDNNKLFNGELEQDQMMTNIYILIPALWYSHDIKAEDRIKKFWYGRGGKFSSNILTFQREVTGVGRHSLEAFLNIHNYDDVAYIILWHNARLKRFFHINENG